MSNYRPFFLCFAVLLPLWLFSVSAQAQVQSAAPVDDPLTVTNVMIDKTDKNAVTARDQAIVEAQRLAFQRFAERSMTPETYKDYRLPDDKTIVALVRDFEIRDEQISANRYMANFTVRFSAEVEDYINGDAVGEASSPSVVSTRSEKSALSVDIAAPLEPKTVLVLPYLRDIFGDKSLLWEDPNPWRETWQTRGNAAPHAGLTIMIPSGDIADISQGSSDAVWHDDYSVIEKLRSGYKADEVVLAVAYKAGAYVQVDIYIYNKAGRLERRKSLAPYDGADAYKTVLRQTIAEIASAIRQVGTLPEAARGSEEMPPSLQELSSGAEETAENILALEKIKFDATMDFADFPQWIEAQNRLSEVAPSAVVEISSLRRNAARFTIVVEWAGGLSGFKKALAENGLGLEKSAAAAGSSRRPLYILTMN